MNKGKVVRLAGFVGALGLSTVLVTTAIQGTGAYFSDSAGGTANYSSGHLKLLTQDVDTGSQWYENQPNLNLDFNGMMPGNVVEHKINYKVDISSGQADIWLVFKTDGDTQTLPADPPPATTTKVGTGYQLFTGGGASPNNGMGRYAEFAVTDSNGGDAFASGNLAFKTSANDPATNGNGSQCVTGQDGRNNTALQNAWTYQEGGAHDPGYYCGVPSKILLAAGLTTNATGQVTVKFATNGPLTTWQDQPGPSVPFTLTAVQHGQQP